MKDAEAKAREIVADWQERLHGQKPVTVDALLCDLITSALTQARNAGLEAAENAVADFERDFNQPWREQLINEIRALKSGAGEEGK